MNQKTRKSGRNGTGDQMETECLMALSSHRQEKNLQEAT